MDKKLQKIYPEYYNLVIVQDLWQAHCQILSIIFLKQLIKLNVNMDTMIEKCETCGITYEVCDCFLKYTNFKENSIECKYLGSNKNLQQNFDEKLKERLLSIFRFPNHDNNQFILLMQDGVTLINMWMIGKNSMKYHYLEKKISTVT